VFSVPLAGGTWRVVYGPEVEVRDTGDHDADVARLTAACTAVVETWVRRHPELWLWMHRRWKTAPPGGTA
jgi:KDO2-lipid IV(A) lauroyltransferase